MLSVLIPALGLVVVAILGLVSQVIAGRNDRALAHHEVYLLKKMAPGTQAYDDLSAVIEGRVQGRKARMFKGVSNDRSMSSGADAGRSLERRDPLMANPRAMLFFAITGILSTLLLMFALYVLPFNS